MRFSDREAIMQPLTFTKMHGLGNDFIVLNCLTTAFDWTTADIIQLANRYKGIGFDQLLIIEPAQSTDVDFTYRIFNADGSEVEHCGNGARCFGKYLHDNGLFDYRRPVKVAVKRGVIEIDYRGISNGAAQYRVDMGIPDFTPFTAEQTSVLNQAITLNDETREYGIVSMGNPHAVTVVANSQTAPVETIGMALQHHPLFPARVNVGFMEILHRGEIKLRVFERGVGETQACGTGACGAVAVGIARQLLDSTVTVHLLGGTLVIDWQGNGHHLFMTGAAETVYTATLHPHE